MQEPTLSGSPVPSTTPGTADEPRPSSALASPHGPDPSGTPASATTTPFNRPIPYGDSDPSPPPGPFDSSTPVDRTTPYDSSAPPPSPAPYDLAALRTAYRDRTPVPLDGLLPHAGTSPRLDVLIGLLLPAAAARHGRAGVAAALRGALRGAVSAPTAAALLDLATEHGHQPLDGPEVLQTYGAAHARGLRHAAWRHVAGHPPDEQTDKALLALADAAPRWTPADQLTWAVAARARGIPDEEVGAGLPGASALARLAPLPHTDGGLTLVQASLRGRLLHPGEGDSGGVSVFLTALGSALAEHSAIGTVVTATLASEAELTRATSWFTPLAPGHHALLVPDFGPGTRGPAQAPYARPHSELGWWLEQLLRLHGVRPDVVHVRVSDDGTWEVARAAPRLGARLAFTAAPDPHRQFFARHPDGRGHPGDAADEDDLHRIFLADELVERADAVFGLPGRAGDDELPRYFAALRPGRPGAKPVHKIPEGLAPLRALPGDDRLQGELVEELFRPGDGLPRLDRALTAGAPLLVNVGRLNPVKQQDLLLRAWLDSPLSRRTGLLLIGGSAASPSPVERDMTARIRALLAAAPWAHGRVAVLPALPNRHVRLLERALGELLPSAQPHTYVCASVKEEFGIAVLEAMDAGLLALGPRRGGLGHYIEHGRNGFLVDTSSGAALRASLDDVLAPGGPDGAGRLRALARAGQDTVRSLYDIRTVRDAFAARYAAMAPA